jgi:hypothetical protein
MELYNSLHENSKHIASSLDDAKKAYLLSTIPKLDEKGHETIFFLIRMHHLHQVREITFDIPYESMAHTDQVTFDLDKFPTQLQHMLYMFVQMHFEYLAYEAARTKKIDS